MHGHQFPCCSVYLFELLLCRFLKWSRIPCKDDCPDAIPFVEISAAELGFQKFSRASGVIHSNFFLLFLLSWWCPLPIFPSTCSFLSLQMFSFFLFLSSILSVVPLFSLFLLCIADFCGKFHTNILDVYLFFRITVACSFYLFAISLKSSMYMRGLIFSRDLRNS